METEVWKDIPGFESYYKASTYGKIINKASGKFLACCPDEQGYMRLNLCVSGRPYHFRLHRVLLITFRGINLMRPVVNHINGNTLDNNLSNLEWCTSSENSLHAYRTGLKRQKKILSDDDVKVIKNLLLSQSQIKISKRFGVSQNTISKIARGVSRFSV